MLLRRLRAALGLDPTAPESPPAASGRSLFLHRVRSALDLGPATAESRRAGALLLPLLGPLVVLAALAPLLGRQSGLPTWIILSAQLSAIAWLLVLVVAMVRRRAR